MSGIGVITNPRSRLNKRDPSAARRLGYLIGSRGSAEATKSLDDLYRVAEEFKKNEIDILGINGGDGTIHHTLTAFIKTYGDQPLPLIAILRGGTMNTIANSLGIKGSPPKLLFELVDRYHNNDPFELLDKRVLAVGDAYGFIFGNGLIYNFLDAYYKTGHPSPSVAARLVFKLVISAIVRGKLARHLTRRVHARISVDGDRWAREDFTAVAASTVEQIGLGFRPFYRCNEQPDKFPVLAIHASSPFSIAMELPRIYRGLPIRRDKAIDTIASDLVFEADGDLEYIIDGDTYIAKHDLKVSLGPSLRLIRLTGNAVSETPLE